MLKVDEAPNEINGAVNSVASIVSDVAAASQEQARGIEQLNCVISELVRVVQQSAAASEESSPDAQELTA